ncbi:unnamed protein product, partial [Prorocentrum cordatum]
GVAREFQSARRPQLLTIKQRRAKSSFRALQWIHQRCREVVALLRAGRKPIASARMGSPPAARRQRPFRRGHLVRQSLCGGYVASAKLRSWGYQASPLRSLRERARDAAWHRAWECSAKERARSRRVCWPTCAVVCRFLLCRAVPAQPLQGRCEPWLQGGPPSGQFSEPLAVRSHRVRGAVAGAGVHDARTPTLVRSLQ